ncbi:uncharacterized protein F4817DRAFT_179954 [Daldinia loculata]|uniref:uncharacterized protein n=1 Tax=Daldinia loculata TaxID=103429 RepID=UPI0020C3E542|nr:uncharacterized protein F4817DRAFT_179954 [Daldinia loculata]KAI1651258.1 hypothetical protein F4817DRAFT_179954 [Daldinia loculata]
MNYSKNDEQETYRTSQVKKIGMDIILCVKLLGGVAALGASIVFPPAELCFKAISLLLDIPKEISDMHGEIKDVLAQIGPTLLRFRIYARIEKFDMIDEGLLQSVHEVMICFVDICALCINVQYGGRWKKLKEKTKRVLFDNKEVADGLKRFEGLVQRQQNTQNTVALEFKTEGGH